MMRHVYLVCLWLVVLTTSVCSQPERAKSNSTKVKNSPKTKVTYIANEGVLIETHGKKVLIDGLLRFYKTPFAYPPDDLRHQLEGAKAPYADIDLVLVSHLHGDHFHPESVGLHLKNAPNVKLATSKQIVEKVKKGFDAYEDIASKIVPIKHEWKSAVAKDFDGINVKFLGLRHGSERFNWIQNFGHVIEIDGIKFLHLGDADMTAENFASFNLHEENIDVAFIPYWFLQSAEGRKLVEEQFKPKNIIAVHVSPSDAKSVLKELESYYPGITVFTKILEEKSFE